MCCIEIVNGLPRVVISICNCLSMKVSQAKAHYDSGITTVGEEQMRENRLHGLSGKVIGSAGHAFLLKRGAGVPGGLAVLSGFQSDLLPALFMSICIWFSVVSNAVIRSSIFFSIILT